MVTRRDLLKAGILSPLLGCSNGQSASPHILIVGAGIAGLSAAQLLSQHQYHVTLLEARERAGGRIWSDHSWSGGVLDLGASWIHGTTGNPIAQLAQQLALPMIRTDNGLEHMYGADGRLVDDETSEELWEAFGDLMAQVDAMRETYPEDRSLRTAINDVFRHWNISASEQQQLEALIIRSIELEYAADTGAMSVWHFDQDDATRGPHVVFPQGYSQLIEALAQTQTIQYGQQATGIRVADSGVQVQTTDRTWSGDYVLITLPLGVLKSGTVQFEPALPAWKQQAIDQLDMGVLNKLGLRFAEPFWGSQVYSINYLNEVAWSDYLSMVPIKNEPTLLGFIGGTMAREVETWNDRDTVAAALDVLRTIYGSTVPDPLDWRITRWGSDPWARGSYSFLPVGVSGAAYDQLATPVGERMYWAGEATWQSQPSTVHGAYLSGQQAAQAIVQHARKV